MDAGVGAPPPPMGAPPPPPMASSGMQENMASALCYALGFITGILFLVLDPYKNNRNIRFHAWQSIFFSAGYAILSIVIGMFFFTMWSFGMFWMLWMLVRLAFLVLWIVLMVKAYNNQRFKLPLIGDLAEKQA